MRNLAVLNYQIGGGVDRDGGDVVEDHGFKPRDPEDPTWLKIMMWVMLAAAVASVPLILFYR